MKISACMMVGHGGERFVRALESLRPHVDELAMVNTNESVDTPDVWEAQRVFGADLKLKHSPWRDHFSEHRNESLDLATGDWCLILDHDEELFCGEGVVLREVLALVPEDAHCVALTVNDVRNGEHAMQFKQPRLFRAGKVRYKGRVHNQPKLLEEGAKTAFLPENGASVSTYGYGLSPEVMQAKHAQRERLLRLALEQDGDKHALFYLGELYGMMGDHRKAQKYFLSYLDEVPAESLHGPVFHAAAAGAIIIGDCDGARSWIDKGLARNPDSIDLLFDLSELGAALNDNKMSCYGALRYLEALRKGVVRGSEFVFHANPSSACVALARVANCRFMEAMTALKDLTLNLPNASGGASGLVDWLAGSMRNMGLSEAADRLIRQAEPAFLGMPSFDNIKASFGGDHA